MTVTKKEARWYFGGMSSAMAVIFTHPLDLIKVHLQTQQTKRYGFLGMGINVVKNEGFLGLYTGLSASFVRQIFYSFPRFGIYEFYKNSIVVDRLMPGYEQIFVSGFSGAVGGAMGNPFDVVNVRMQNDMKLPVEQRRGYKHVFDGLYIVAKNEGPSAFFKGVSMTTSRGILMTIGQASGYDECKRFILMTGWFTDNPITHFISGVGAGVCATLLAQPFDVMKTRLMNAPPGTYSGIIPCAADIFVHGPLGFYKGLTPAFIRIGPQTVILYMIKEQLVKYFGYSKT